MNSKERGKRERTHDFETSRFARGEGRGDDADAGDAVLVRVGDCEQKSAKARVLLEETSSPFTGAQYDSTSRL